MAVFHIVHSLDPNDSDGVVLDSASFAGDEADAGPYIEVFPEPDGSIHVWCSRGLIIEPHSIHSVVIRTTRPREQT